ncbi:MAG TPA: membrane dipeptidase [Gemmatimonadaceae bacterium]|nr:membrane dipeptidase [Gemmatimonadaceae bacterium]
MHQRHGITRREFNRLAAAAVVAPGSAGIGRALAGGTSAATAVPATGAGTMTTRAWPGYDRAFVLDFLASPGPFNTPITVPQLTPEMVANAAASGITAVNLTIGGRDPESVFRDMAKWEDDIRRHPDVLMNVRSVADLAAAKAGKKFGLIYGFQDSVAVGDDLSRVALFHAFGIRIIQVTYNVHNLVGDGCLEPVDHGLTPFGHDFVAELNAKRIIVDTGHTGIRTTEDAIAASKVPIAISHSGCRAIANRPRSKPDETLKKLADRGGVIGIYLMPFLTMGPQPTSDDLLQHIEHAANVAGEDHVGIGSDLSTTPHVVDAEYMRVHRTFVENRIRQGIAAPGEDPEVPMFTKDLNAPRRMEMIADKLAARGHTAARIEKIIGGNFHRLCREVWGA